jgi:uncharacterized coiled-coil protein SlyX
MDRREKDRRDYQDKKNEGWKIDKTFNLSHAASVLGLAICVLTFYIKNETRISALELAMTYQQNIAIDTKKDNAQQISQLTVKVDKMTDKIDDMTKLLYSKNK